MIPFIGIDIIKNGTELETCVYRKPTNTGLLLHFQSHATNVTKPVYWRPCTITPMSCHLRQKPSIRNVPNYVPSSATLIFNWPHPASILPLMSEKKTDDGNTIRIVLPFKDQIAANSVHTRQFSAVARPNGQPRQAGVARGFGSMQLRCNCVISTIRLTSLHSLFLWAKNWSKVLSLKKLSRVL